MIKPTLRRSKNQKGWQLVFLEVSNPRSFDLFGASEEQRLRMMAPKVKKAFFDTQKEGLSYLDLAYKNNKVWGG